MGTSLNVSGSFLQGHTLIFKGGQFGDAEVSWDGVDILQGDMREISLGLVRLKRRDAPVKAWQRLEATNTPVNAWSAGVLIRSYDVTLPLGVEMTVNTVHWLDRRGNLDLLLTMHPEPEGQSGHCGNFNGDPNDDTLDMMRSMASESPSEARGAEHPAEEAGYATE